MTRGRRFVFAAVTVVGLLLLAEGVCRLVAGPSPPRSVFQRWGDGVGEASWSALFAGVVGAGSDVHPPTRDRSTPWFLPAETRGGEVTSWKRDDTKFAYRPNDPGRIATVPPAGKRRLFALGGSTTFGIPGAVGAAFSDVLAERLGVGWDVHNVAAAGFDTEDIRGIVDETARFHPAVYVFYEGHNDCGNAFFLRRYLTTTSPRLMRADVLLWNGSRAYSLLREELEPWRRYFEAKAVRSADTADVIRLRAEVADHQREMVVARFRENVEHMIAVARGVGARFILVTPVSQAHMPPRRSAHHRVLTPEEDARFEAALAAARRGEASIDTLRAAAASDPQYAELAYFLGEAEIQGGDPVAGARWLRAARDWDLVTNRAVQPVVDAVRAIAAEEGVPLVDAEVLLAGADGLPDPAWFVDEVHLTPAAHLRIGEALVPVVRAEAGP